MYWGIRKPNLQENPTSFTLPCDFIEASSFSGPWCSCLYSGARCFGSDTLSLRVPKGIMLVPWMGAG